LSKKKDTSHLKVDPTAESRKKDHIELAFKSSLPTENIDRRFYYEPIISGHPDQNTIPKTDFLGYKLDLPIWVSSMTGGTKWAETINTNLAKACGEFGMGMGLGSCRSLLMENDRLSDFAIKKHMPNQPLYANLGIAQIEELAIRNRLKDILELVKKLDADGLIIHINPLQEWLQPEGDRYYQSPILLIKRVIDECPNLSVIVKEVGQGFGPKSLKALYELPIDAVDFGASGGTNFSILELLRSSEENMEAFENLTKVGHCTAEMVEMVKKLHKNNSAIKCNQTIISGGIRNYLDGYYAIQKIGTNAIYGQASGFLKHARGNYEGLQKHIERQISGLKVAYAFLSVK